MSNQLGRLFFVEYTYRIGHPPICPVCEQPFEKNEQGYKLKFIAETPKHFHERCVLDLIKFLSSIRWHTNDTGGTQKGLDLEG